MTELTVSENARGKRIDAYIAEVTETSRSGVAKQIENGDITVNGAPVSKKYAVKPGDIIEIAPQETEEYDAVAEDIPLDIVYEDNDIIVINKPKGMVVHPAPGNYTGTLVNALLYHCKDTLSGIGGVMRPGIVHRIDKDTTGLIVVAKNDAAHTSLSEQLEYHGVTREYHALVRGGFKNDSGTVDAPIGRHPVDRKKMAVLTSATANAKRAVTHFEVMERYSDITYLKLHLETGRTHQIRVHMASLGHPLLGDGVYGGGGTQFEARNRELIKGQCLFATELHLTHPRTKEKMVFKADLPDNFVKIIEKLRQMG